MFFQISVTQYPTIMAMILLDSRQSPPHKYEHIFLLTVMYGEILNIKYKLFFQYLFIDTQATLNGQVLSYE